MQLRFCALTIDAVVRESSDDIFLKIRGLGFRVFTLPVLAK